MHLNTKHLHHSRADLPIHVGSVYSGSFLYPHDLAVILAFEILSHFNHLSVYKS